MRTANLKRASWATAIVLVAVAFIIAAIRIP